VRVRLKGINSKRKVLSDGTVKTYWYAWKGGRGLSASPVIQSSSQAITKPSLERSRSPKASS